MLEELKIAKDAVRQAGKLLCCRERVSIDDEQGRDIKLNKDKESEAILIEGLQKTGYSIISEELGEIKGSNNDCTWIVDPLDGTANYWRGMDELSCISVALWKNDEPIMGIIYRFALDDLYVGIIGQGAWKNEVPIHASLIAKTSGAFLATGFPVRGDFSDEGMKRFSQDAVCFKKVRMLGAAAVMGCLVAEGKVDAYIERGIMLWDIAASTAIVKAAGGVVEVVPLDNHRCICQFFANSELRLNYQSRLGLNG